MRERALSPHEAAMIGGDMRVVTIWEVRGDLDVPAVERALHALTRVYPLAGGRVAFRGDRGYLQVPEADTTPVRLHRADALAPELNVETDWLAGPLLRMTLISEGRRHRLVSTLPRGCVEGTGLIALQQRFWSLYAAECLGQAVAPTPVQPVLAESIEDRLRHKYSASELREYVAQRAQEESLHPPAQLPNRLSGTGVSGSDATYGTTRVTLDPATTTALADIAHRHEMSVNSLVCGLVVAALRSSLEPATGPLRVSCGIPVDLRRRMTPPIPPEIMLSAAAGFPVKLLVEEGADPVALGRELSAGVRAHLEAETAERELATFANMVNHYAPTCTITNLGAITVPDLPGDQVVTDLHILPMTRIPMPFVVVSRFDGSLRLDIPFSRACYPDALIEAIAARTRDVVQATVSRHGDTPEDDCADAHGLDTAAAAL